MIAPRTELEIRGALQAEHWTTLQLFLGLVDDMAKTLRRNRQENGGKLARAEGSCLRTLSTL